VNGENVLIKNRLVDSKSFYQIGCYGRPAWVGGLTWYDDGLLRDIFHHFALYFVLCSLKSILRTFICIERSPNFVLRWST
jgi:hypothetical protein